MLFNQQQGRIPAEISKLWCHRLKDVSYAHTLVLQKELQKVSALVCQWNGDKSTVKKPKKKTKKTYGKIGFVSSMKNPVLRLRSIHWSTLLLLSFIIFTSSSLKERPPLAEPKWSNYLFNHKFYISFLSKYKFSLKIQFDRKFWRDLIPSTFPFVILTEKLTNVQIGKGHHNHFQCELLPKKSWPWLWTIH